MSQLNRRNLLLGAGAVSLAACANTEVTPVTPVLGKSANTKLELANEKLVDDFCTDWSTGDVEILGKYLSDDVAYQIVEHAPMVNSLVEFKERVQPFLNNFNSIRWETLRSSVMGPVVMNDRIDYYEEPVKGESMIFYVVGTFVVQDNKIIDWRDWSTPVVTHPKQSS